MRYPVLRLPTALTVVLRGVGSYLLGPAFAFAAKTVDVVRGRASLRDAVFSLALVGLLDFWLDFPADEYVPEDRPPRELRRAAEEVAKTALDQGVSSWLGNYEIRRRPSGLYTARTAIVDVASGSPHVEQILRRRVAPNQAVVAVTGDRFPTLPGQRLPHDLIEAQIVLPLLLAPSQIPPRVIPPSRI